MLLAQTPTNSIINPATYPPMAVFSDIGGLTKVVMPIISTVAALIFLGMLLYAAYNVMTAGGEAEKIEKAKGIATYAVIGLLIIVFAFLIVRIIGAILKVPVQI